MRTMSLSRGCSTDSFCSAPSSATPNKRGRRGKVDEALGSIINTEQVRKARRVVTEAMKDDATALQLQYLIESKKLKIGKKTKNDDVLPPACNKYQLTGKDRMQELFVYLEPDFDVVAFATLTLTEAQELLTYVLALGENAPFHHVSGKSAWSPQRHGMSILGADDCTSWCGRRAGPAPTPTIRSTTARQGATA